MNTYEKGRRKANSSVKTETGNDVKTTGSSRLFASNQSALDAFGLNESAGTKSALPEAMQNRLQNHFGYDLSSLRIRESNEAQRLGGLALTKGNDIHFQPGILSGRVSNSERIIAHEVSHAVSQATEGRSYTDTPGVVVDPISEKAADRSADGFLSGGMEMAEPTAVLSLLPAAPVNAPAEGWDIGTTIGKPVHEDLTEAARMKAIAALEAGTVGGARKGYSSEFKGSKAKKSLEYGSRLNDISHLSEISAGAKIRQKGNSNDAFINQSHYGDMQFLHGMDSSDGDTAANVKKMQRYAKFASDVFQNRKIPGQDDARFQDMNMLDYVLSQNDPDDPFQEMMLSTMIDPSKLKEIDSKNAATWGGLDPAERRRARTQEIRNQITFTPKKREDARKKAEKEYEDRQGGSSHYGADREEFVASRVKAAEIETLSKRSSYATGTVGNFFTGGDKELDAGMVALGSASHMLEDSFAGSHTIRGDNLYLGTTPDTALSLDGRDIVNKATPIIVNADYTQQDNDFIGGRHGKADVLEPASGGRDEFTSTQGASLARDSAAQFMMMNVMMKKDAKRLNKDADAGAYSGSSLDTFVHGITRVDPNVTRRPSTGGVSGGVTASGRGYATKPDTKLEKQAAKTATDEYWRLTGSHIVGNKHTTAMDRAGHFKQELTQLEEMKKSGSPALQHKARSHATEMLINVEGMLRQLDAAQMRGKPEWNRLEELRVQLSGF